MADLYPPNPTRMTDVSFRALIDRRRASARLSAAFCARPYMCWDGDEAALRASIERWVADSDSYSVHSSDDHITVLLNGVTPTEVRRGDRVVAALPVCGYLSVDVVNGSAGENHG